MEFIGYYEMLKALEDVPDMEARNKARASVAETVEKYTGLPVQAFWELYRVYDTARQCGLAVPDLDGSQYHIPALADAFRLFGIRRFTVSSGYSGLPDMLAALADAGCRMDGMTKITRKWPVGEPDVKNAIAFTVGEKKEWHA